jgi:predicted dehydrogenase
VEGFTESRKPSGLDRVRLGVLGAGNFATRVALPAIGKVEEIKLSGIASASGSNAQNAARKFGFAYAASDEGEIFSDPEIDAVAIFTRHNLHAYQTRSALMAGKHVYCEKPLALHVDDLNGISEALGGDGVGYSAGQAPLLTVGYNRRFAPLSRLLAEFLEGSQEPLAAIYRVNAGYLPIDHWLQDPEIGGGRIIGEACHFIDYLTFLAGAPPVSVSAAGLPDGGRYREDNVMITLAFPDGSAGSVVYLANGDKSFTKERLEVFCGGRAAVLDDFRSLEMAGGSGNDRRGRRWASQDKGHQAAWEAFSAAVLRGSPPPIPYDQIFGGTRAAIAAVEALRSGEKIIL